jgi:membrane fusion protein (multidrug efflux system)
MKRNILIATVGIGILLNSCKSPSKEDKIAETQKKIEAAQIELQKLNAELKSIGGATEAVGGLDNIAVTTIVAESKPFNVFVNVSGKIITKENILLAAEMGGILQNISVVSGQAVKKGQIIATVDKELIEKTIEEVETQLRLAKDIFERQKNLWDQKIGSELQYLQAKNNVETLQDRIASIKSQMDKTNIRATINGVVDEVFARRGEMVGPGTPILRLINLANVEVEAEVPEIYLGKCQRGQKVVVEFPNVNASTRSAVISSITQFINPNSRTFKVNATIGNSDGMMKPNVLAIMKLNEYSSLNNIVLPTKLIQQTFDGEFVYAVDDSSRVVKLDIVTGKTANGLTEIIRGIEPNTKLIDKGYRNVNVGDKITIK